MKYCMYCNTLMAADAIFCPKCGRKQEFINDSLASNNADLTNIGVNFNAPLPVGINNGSQPALDVDKVSAYKNDIGLGPNTDYVYFVSTGSSGLRAGLTTGALEMLGASRLESFAGGAVAGHSTVDYMISFEPTGILFIGLHQDLTGNDRFSGQNSFLSDKKIDSISYSHGILTITTNGYDMRLKVPHTACMVLSQDRKALAKLVNRKYHDSKIADHIQQRTIATRHDRKIETKYRSKFYLIFAIIIALFIGFLILIAIYG